MTTTHLVLMILVAGACTFATRLFPFALFGQSKEVPKFVKYLGNVLPLQFWVYLSFTALKILKRAILTILSRKLSQWS